MSYITVSPRGANDYKKRGGRKSSRTSREFYKGGADRVPDMCRACDNNYRFGLLKAFDTSARNIGLYDIDLVLEVDGRILAIGEYKRFKQEYQEFLIPAFEYVALKKVAKMMRVACFLIVELVKPRPRESEYRVWMVDRFERPGDRPMKEMKGKKWAAFDPEYAVRLDTDGLTEWMNALIASLGGDGGGGDE